MPKTLGLRSAPLRPPISNSESLQPSAIQIIINGPTLDGYVQHVALPWHTAPLVHFEEVKKRVKPFSH